MQWNYCLLAGFQDCWGYEIMHLRLLCHCIKVKVGVGRICPMSQKREVHICFRMQVLAYWLLILGLYWGKEILPLMLVSFCNHYTIFGSSEGDVVTRWCGDLIIEITWEMQMSWRDTNQRKWWISTKRISGRQTTDSFLFSCLTNLDQLYGRSNSQNK